MTTIPLRHSYQYTHISTNTTPVAKPSPGSLLAVVINTKGASANTATIYDNTAGSGTVIAVVDTTSALGTIITELNQTVSSGSSSQALMMNAWWPGIGRST